MLEITVPVYPIEKSVLPRLLEAKNIRVNEYAGVYMRQRRFEIRPLAKLDKAVKITDTSNQGKAECETVSAVAIGLREDTEPFDKADSVFNKDTLP